MAIIRIPRLLYFLTIFTCSACIAQSYHFFIPPDNWKLADPKKLSPMVEVCFLGKGKTSFYPSVNIATEEIDISAKEYMSIVVKMHKNDPNIEFRALGKIKTKAATADLFELTTKTNFGLVKMLQMVVIKDKKVFVLTGSMHIDEFKTLSKSILRTFQSFQIVDNLTDCVSDQAKKQNLVKAIENLKESKSIKDKNWKRFEKMVLKDFKELGEFWQLQVMKDVYNKNISSSK